MAFAGQTPTIVVLKEGLCSFPPVGLVLVGLHAVLTIVLFRHTGTDASQGKGQIISNINACVAVQATVKSTLGPYGGDLLLVDSNGRQTITNDGATVMKVRCIDYRTPYTGSSTGKMILTFCLIAFGYCAPRRPHPHGYRPVPRRRSR